MFKVISNTAALTIIVGMMLVGTFSILYTMSKNASDYKCFSTGIVYTGKDVDLNDRGQLVTKDGICKSFKVIDK